MKLLRISGHSGAGKSRLTRALRAGGVMCPQVVLYTSRPARVGEAHGRDYYFLSRAAISALPEKDFCIGPVRDMIQAVDLVQLEMDLRSSDLVLIEIFHKSWSRLTSRMAERLGNQLQTESVFLTAVDPEALRGLNCDEARAARIRSEVEGILVRRGKNEPYDIRKRSEGAVKEILEALGPDGSSLYSKILHSSPEGPDGQDDWTRAEHPLGNARSVVEVVTRIVRAPSQP